MYELYGLLARWRPAPAVGFAALAAMVIVARYGTVRGVLEIAVVATLPVAFLVVIARGQRGAATVSIAGTLLGVYWIGSGVRPRRAAAPESRTATGSSST